MSGDSKIEWTDHTFNPWWGCNKVSPGCDNCYALKLAERWHHNVWGPPKATPRRFFGPKHWNEPLVWNARARKVEKPARVFCASMADVFEYHPDPRVEAARQALWQLIEATPFLTWLLLTKRPEAILRMIPPTWRHDPRRNVRFGTSAEDQERANLRIPRLLKVPAAGRFLSAEPLLGEIDLTVLHHDIEDGEWRVNSLSGEAWCENSDSPSAYTNEIPRLDWVIVGGESGGPPERRLVYWETGSDGIVDEPGWDPIPEREHWVRSLRDQCVAAGVPFFFKQWGGPSPESGGHLLDGRTWDEYPVAH